MAQSAKRRPPTTEVALYRASDRMCEEFDNTDESRGFSPGSSDSFHRKKLDRVG